MTKLQNLIHRGGILLCTVAVFSMSHLAHAAGTLTPIGSQHAPMQVVDHHVDIVMNNGFARTEVTQTFYNPNHENLEAVYAFPVPKNASLSEMTIIIGETEIHGEVIERDEAEAIYEHEANNGNDAGLAVKNEYLTYEFRVSPVRAQDQTQMRFVYYQPLEIDTGIGRYVYPLEDGGTDDAGKSFWLPNEEVKGTFSIAAEIKSAVPIEDVRMPGYEQAALIDRLDAGHYQIRVDQAGNALSRDVVIYYRLPDGLPGGVELIPYRASDSEPGTFMMVVTPGVDLAPLANGSDYVFVLDVSGSMSGKIATLARGLSRALGELRPEDRFRVVTFSNHTKDLTHGWRQATPDEVQGAIAIVENLSVEGGTNLYAGIREGLEKLDDDRVTSLILVTDAVANQGIIEPKAFRELMRQYDVRVFGFLLGNSGNWPLMRTICDATGGFYAGVSNADDIMGQLMLAKSKITHEAMHDVSVRLKGVDTFDLTNDMPKKVYRGEQLVIFGRYDEAGKAKLSLTAHISGEDKLYETNFDFPEIATDNPEIERLWAMSQIEQIEDQVNAGLLDSTEGSDAIADLGVAYQLVTDETAMLVLRDEDFERYGIDRANRDRVATENQAQARRASQTVTNNRVDRNDPLFNLPTPSLGGGALDPFSVLIVAGGVGLCLRRRKDQSGDEEGHVSR